MSPGQKVPIASHDRACPGKRDSDRDDTIYQHFASATGRGALIVRERHGACDDSEIAVE